MNPLKVIFIDDEINKDNTTRIKEILEEEGIFSCTIISPDQITQVDELICDIFITDFELAKVKMTGISFSGNTLSTEYRNRYPNTPIVLLTEQGVFSSRSKAIRTDNTDLDLIWYKSDVANKPEEFLRQMKGLANGFVALANENNNSRTWNALLHLLNATERELQELRETNSPIQRDRWIIPEIAEWIRHVIIEYPGVLLDSHHAAVHIGMDPDDFSRDMDLMKLFEPAKYTGIFHEFGQRWWRRQFIDIASDLILTQNISKPLLEAFVPAFNKAFVKQTRHAVCIWDDTTIADSICFIENKPVKSRNSVLYRPDNRPAYMEQARVSRQAITHSNNFDEFLVDPDSADIADHWIEMAQEG